MLFGRNESGNQHLHDGLDERGHLIEIYEPTTALERLYDMVRDAAIGWDGADPVRTL